jgi:hypothetical protein
MYGFLSLGQLFKVKRMNELVDFYTVALFVSRYVTFPELKKTLFYRRRD